MGMSRYVRIHLPVEVLLGAGALSLIGPELSSLEVGRVLLVYGEGLGYVAERVVESLGGMCVRRVEVEDLCLPPRAGDVEEVARLLRGCDFVVAVGSGEVMDLARAVAARAEPREGVAGGPAALIPIAPGIDRAVSRRVALRGGDRGAVVRMSSPRLYPRLAILDPALVDDSGGSRLAMLCAEILVNSLEVLASSAADNFSLLLAGEALRAALRAPRLSIAEAYWAALCAALACTRCGGGACSALARSLSALYELNYYLAAAALLVPWLEHVIEAARDRLGRALARAGLGSCEEVLGRVREVLERAGLLGSLTALGVRSGEVDVVVEHAWTYERSSIEADLGVSDKYSLREILLAAAGRV